MCRAVGELGWRRSVNGGFDAAGGSDDSEIAGAVRAEERLCVWCVVDPLAVDFAVHSDLGKRVSFRADELKDVERVCRIELRVELRAVNEMPQALHAEHVAGFGICHPCVEVSMLRTLQGEQRHFMHLPCI